MGSPLASVIGSQRMVRVTLNLSLAAGLDLVEACRRGVAAGTAATLSADHSFCHREHLARLLPQSGVPTAGVGQGARDCILGCSSLFAATGGARAWR
jgi:hypothetical protein